MPKEGLSTYYETVDFDDRLGKSADVKEFVLHVARLEEQLKRSGRVELTHDTLRYVMDHGVRASVEGLMKGSVSLELSEGDLPLLFRATLLEAYLQEKLAEGLSGMEEVCIAPTAAEHKVIGEPKGSELRQALRLRLTNPRFKADHAALAEIMQTVDELADTTQLPKQLYDAVFGQSGASDIRALAASVARGAAESALTVSPSQSLQADHVGGRSDIDFMMHHATRERDFYRPADEAFSKDRMRWIFQGSAREKSHHVLTFARGWYAALAPNEKHYVNGLVLRNLTDALCVEEARTLFPQEIPPEVFTASLTRNMFGLGGNAGVDGDRKLDVDKEKFLNDVAMGCQSVLDAFRSTSKQQALMVIDQTQVASEQRRRRQNVSIFSLFGNSNFSEREGSADPIQATNLWEYLGIQDSPELQQSLYEAFGRRFGATFRGTTPEESWTRTDIRLTRDGIVTCRFVDDQMYEETSDDEPWDLFEAIHKKDKPLPQDYKGPKNPMRISDDDDPYGLRAEWRAEYVRQGFFHPNIPHMVEAMRDEAAAFEPLLAEARALTGKNGVQVEKSLLWSRNPEIDRRILDLREQLALLHEFITPHLSEWLAALGLDALPRDTDAVKKAFRGQVKSREAHPDRHQHDPVRMKAAADDLKRLTRACDELVAQVGGIGNSRSVSAYVGRPLDIIERKEEGPELLA